MTWGHYSWVLRLTFLIPFLQFIALIPFTDGAATIYYFPLFISAGTCHLMVKDYSRTVKERAPATSLGPGLEPTTHNIKIILSIWPRRHAQCATPNLLVTSKLY